MKFESFNIKKNIIDILNSNGYINSTNVQSNAIPKLLKYQNSIFKSKTGSGKTHSFLIPIINNLDFSIKKTQSIIVVPTKELALQTLEFLKPFKQSIPSITIKALISGITSKNNNEECDLNSNIVITTPGKINSILKSDLSFLRYIILDEIDMLYEDDSFNDILSLIKINNDNKTCVAAFSATMPQELITILKKNIYKVTYYNLDSEVIPSSINNYAVNSKHLKVQDALKIIINKINPYLMFIFCSENKDVKSIYNFLNKDGLNVAMISSELNQSERKTIIKRIKNNEFKIVVSSDISSRGIDVDNISDVVSIDLPKNLKYFLHRIGRTGRNGKSGNSYFLYDNDSIDKLNSIEKLNIKFTYLKINGDDLVLDNKDNKYKKNKSSNSDEKLNKEIIKIKNKNKKIKPCYKKKAKKQIQIAKDKYNKKVKYFRKSPK